MSELDFDCGSQNFNEDSKEHTSAEQETSRRDGENHYEDLQKYDKKIRDFDIKKEVDEISDFSLDEFQKIEPIIRRNDNKVMTDSDEHSDLRQRLNDLEEGEIKEKNKSYDGKAICKYFKSGKCRYGQQCRFIHDTGSGYGMFSNQSYGQNVFFNLTSPTPQLALYQPIELNTLNYADMYNNTWEQGLCAAKKLLSRAKNLKETDVEFEEKKLYMDIEQDIREKNKIFVCQQNEPAHIVYGKDFFFGPTSQSASYQSIELNSTEMYNKTWEQDFCSVEKLLSRSNNLKATDAEFEDKKFFLDIEQDTREKKLYHPKEPAHKTRKCTKSSLNHIKCIHKKKTGQKSERKTLSRKSVDSKEMSNSRGRKRFRTNSTISSYSFRSNSCESSCSFCSKRFQSDNHCSKIKKSSLHKFRSNKRSLSLSCSPSPLHSLKNPKSKKRSLHPSSSIACSKKHAKVLCSSKHKLCKIRSVSRSCSPRCYSLPSAKRSCCSFTKSRSSKIACSTKKCATLSCSPEHKSSLRRTLLNKRMYSKSCSLKNTSTSKKKSLYRSEFKKYAKFPDSNRTRRINNWLKTTPTVLEGESSDSELTISCYSYTSLSDSRTNSSFEINSNKSSQNSFSPVVYFNKKPLLNSDSYVKRGYKRESSERSNERKKCTRSYRKEESNRYVDTIYKYDKHRSEAPKKYTDEMYKCGKSDRKKSIIDTDKIYKSDKNYKYDEANKSRDNKYDKCYEKEEKNKYEDKKYKLDTCRNKEYNNYANKINTSDRNVSSEHQLQPVKRVIPETYKRMLQNHLKREKSSCTLSKDAPKPSPPAEKPFKRNKWSAESELLKYTSSVEERKNNSATKPIVSTFPKKEAIDINLTSPSKNPHGKLVCDSDMKISPPPVVQNKVVSKREQLVRQLEAIELEITKRNK